jgi:murein DD-endopeptidase MepM/ murein hydrolase activator NlpD
MKDIAPVIPAKAGIHQERRLARHDFFRWIPAFAGMTMLVLLASGCTQDPAEVSYKGDEFYGRVHEGALDSPNHETFPENSPRIKEGYARPVEQAKVQSVGVSDLSPPTPQAGAQQVASIQPSPYTNQQRSQTTGNGQFIWPVADGKIVSHFGPKAGGRSNDGINIAVAEGEPIWAAAGGAVVYAGSDLKGYGNMIIVRHTNGWMTAYAHARSLAVKKGDAVKQGDIIAYVGMTGGVPSPQLHFAIRSGRTPVDPELYLPKSIAGR